MINPLLIAALIVGTWNGNWFPSGRAEHRAHPAVEAATVSAAAKMLAEGIRMMDPEGTNDVIICLQEMMNPQVVTNLVRKIRRKGLRVASVSRYRRRDRFDTQQDAIVTTLPVVEADWGLWTRHGKETPPRGYAFAAVVVNPATTANVYAVHLKSNYGQGDNQVIAALNRAKRTHAIEQLLAREQNVNRKTIVAGDFNADCWALAFAEEKTFPLFKAAGFVNLLEMLPPKGRGTHPNARYGDSALDYIMVRGFSGVKTPRLVPNDGLSDHLAVFSLIR